MADRNDSADEINLMEYWGVVKKRRKFIAYFVGSIIILTVITSLLSTKYYKSEAVIMPVSNQGGGRGLSVLSQIGGLSSFVGIAGGQNPLQQFLALLKSRTLAEDVINKLNLMPVLFKNYDPQKAIHFKMEYAVSELWGSVKFMDDKKSGTVTISGEFKDPKLATDVVNGYVECLQNFINNNALTSAKRYRIFIEEQLERNKRQLLEAGRGLNEFYKGGNISSVESKVDVATIESLGSDFRLKELNQKKNEIDSKLSIKDIPQQVYLQYLTFQRSLLVQINALLTQQYEMAKMEETKDDLAFQVIDPARVPESRSKPNRRQMVMMAFVASLFIGIFVSILWEYVEKMKTKGKG